MKNRKAGLAIHWYILIIFFFIGLGTFFYYYATSSVKIPTRFIGEFQFNLIKNFQNSEKALFYIDQSAKYASYQAIYELGQKGGYEKSDCDSYLGYNIWIDFDDKENLIECYPKTEGIEDNLKSIFKKNLDGYLVKYPDVLIPQDNYQVSFKGKLNIIGEAIRNIIINIGEEEKLIKKEVAKGIFAWPLDLSDKSKLHYLINSCKGSRNCKPPCTTYTEGTDINADEGDPVYAVADGIVVFVGGEYNTVKIKHEKIGYETNYLHNSRISVKNGEEVTKNQKIAEVGGYGPEGPNMYPHHLDYRILDIKTGEWEDALSFYNRIELGLEYSVDSNCYYYSQQYAYAYEIKQNLFT